HREYGCVCVCVCERERERERERKKRERESVCVCERERERECVCVCVDVHVWLFACIIDNHNNQLTIFPSVSFLSFLKYRFSLLLFFILDTTCRGRSRVHEHVSLSFISVDSCLQFTTQ